MTDLTFGIEYELKLRLTKAQVQAELDSNPDTRHLQVITNPGPVRLLNVGPQYLQNNYHNFALRDTSPSPTSPPFTSILVNRGTGKPSEYQGYGQEILRIIQKRLASVPGYEDTAIYQGTAKKQTDFSGAKLHLTTDASLNGLSHEAKLCMGLSEAEAQVTDFAGAEVVTAPHTCPAAAALEAETIATALGPHITDAETAMHVHVGKPDGSAFAPRVLQHLAYLCIKHESSVAHLTTPGKRGTGFETLSNRTEFLAEWAPGAATTTTTTTTRLAAFAFARDGRRGSATRAAAVDVLHTYQPLSRVRERVMAAPVPALKRLVGGSRGALVNFSYCDRKAPAAATVEFRQHFGTLGRSDVLHWSRHCVALVALAQRRADADVAPFADGEGEEEEEEEEEEDWSHGECIEDLWREMRLPEDTRMFYRRRKDEFWELYGNEGITPLWEVAGDEEGFYDDDDDGGEEQEEEADHDHEEDENGHQPDMWDVVDDGCECRCITGNWPV